MWTTHGHGLAVNFGRVEPKSEKKDPMDKTLTLMNFHFSTGMWLCVGPGKVGSCAFTFSDVRQAARNQIR